MSGKFMRIKRIVIPTITMVIIASQLMGCSAANRSEIQQMLNEGRQIEIEIATPISEEQGTQVQIDWVQLDKLDTYATFRAQLDDIMKISRFGDNSKNGIAYINLEGNQEGNNTLYNAMMNRKFIANFYENDTAELELQQIINSLYTDTEESETMVAAINAYWNLLPDSTPSYFNGGSTLSRLEAMSLIARASTQVTDEVGNQAFTDAVGQNEFTDLASIVANDSYLTLSDMSLNTITANKTITRGEYIYMLVSNVFGSDRMSRADIQKASFNDCKNGGDLAKKDNLPEECYDDNYLESAILKFALDNPDKGCPERMYRALATAQELGIIGSDTRWDEGLTKAEAIQLYLDALQAYTSENGYPIDQTSGTGDTSGEIVEAEQPIEQGNPDNGSDVAGMDNPDGMTDEEINAEVIDESDSIEASDFEIISMDEVTMYCTANSANIRKGPNTGYDKVGTLSYAQEVTINGKVETADSTWFILKTDNTNDIQMVSSSLLSTTKPASQTQQTSKPTGNTDNTSNTSNDQPSNDNYGGFIIDGGGGPAMNDGWTPPADSDPNSNRGGLH